jgi:hypothetical protein
VLLKDFVETVHRFLPHWLFFSVASTRLNPHHEFTAIKSPSHVVQTDPPLENPCPENQSLVLTFAIKLRNLG